MSRAYTVGRGSGAEIKIAKEHDAVGKLHIEIQAVGAAEARVTDLKSTNGTFVRVGKNWEEIKGTRLVALDAELMLGDFRTTARQLLAGVSATPPPPPLVDSKPRKYQSTKEEAPPPAKKRSGPRRNEFGEIVNE